MPIFELCLTSIISWAREYVHWHVPACTQASNVLCCLQRFADVVQSLSRTQELKNHVVSSREDLDNNRGQDFLARLIIGIGTALGFLAMLAVNTGQQLQNMLNSVAMFQKQQQTRAPAIPVHAVQHIGQGPPQIAVTPYSGY